jgi:hypothetical protein
LEIFILLSSLSGIIGNASQSAYAAVSAYLDAFASHVRATYGTPATSVDLGVVRDVGYVAENAHLARAIENQGLGTTISSSQLTALMEAAILGVRTSDDDTETDTLPAQFVTGLGQWSAETSHASFSTLLFAHYRQASSFDTSRQLDASTPSAQDGTQQRPRELLSAARSLAEAQDAVLAGLSKKIVALLMLSDDHEVSGGAHSMSEYGMDSLVAIEMRNWIFREFDVMVPVLELLANVRVDEMAARVVRESRVTSKTVLAGEE